MQCFPSRFPWHRVGRQTAGFALAVAFAHGLQVSRAEVSPAPAPPAQSAEVAQSESTARDRVEQFWWAMTGSAHFYREPQMQIVGPAVGFRGEARVRAAERPVIVEAELGAGIADYSSPVSGNIDGIRRVGSALFARSAEVDDRQWMPQPGLGLTTEWTDLRGTSSLGKRGYERFNLALWLSANWALERERAEGATRLRAAVMLHGWQWSGLAQANPTYLNVLNKQRRGALVSVERFFRIEDSRASLRLGVRAVGNSDTVAAGVDVTAYEPTNRTVELTLTVWR
jgi:hypothetical protein